MTTMTDLFIVYYCVFFLVFSPNESKVETRRDNSLAL